MELLAVGRSERHPFGLADEIRCRLVSPRGGVVGETFCGVVTASSLCSCPRRTNRPALGEAHGGRKGEQELSLAEGDQQELGAGLRRCSRRDRSEEIPVASAGHSRYLCMSQSPRHGERTTLQEDGSVNEQSKKDDVRE